jgi:HSP20 family protein
MARLFAKSQDTKQEDAMVQVAKKNQPGEHTKPGMEPEMRRERAPETGPTPFRPANPEPSRQTGEERGGNGRGESSWDKPLETLRHGWDRAMESFPGSWPFGKGFDRASFWHRFSGDEPIADIVEHEDKYEIALELPGVEEKDIHVRLSNGSLTVRGEKHGEREEKRKDYYLSERSFGSFQRTFRVPDGVDADKVTAEFKNGLLTVMLPKTQEAQQREKRIPVKSG